MRRTIALLIALTCFGCSKGTDPTYHYITAKPAVIVVESGETITDVQVLENIPEERITLTHDAEVSVLVFGASVKANPFGTIATGKEVILFTEGGQIKEMAGDSLRFKVKIDNATLSRVHKYLSNKPSEATR